jgi:TP901 family phage tail tape measure protein
MADAASGGDEIKRIILRAEALNFSGTQKEVLALNQALENLKKTLTSGAGLNKGQLNDINKELDILEKKATNSTNASKKGLDDMRASAEKLNQTLKNTAQMSGANFTGSSSKDKQALKDYQKELSTLGVGIVAKPKYVSQVVGNVQTIWGALKEGKNAGIATQRSLDSIATGLPSSMPTVTSLQRISVAAGVARKGLDGVTVAMKNSAKNAQWTGMQMIQGITLPLVGVGTVALRTFDSVNKEMIQLKKVTEYKEDYTALEKEIQKVAVAYGMTLKSSATLFTDIAALGKSGKDIGEWSDSIAQLAMVGDIDPAGATQFFRVINAIFTDGSIEQTNEILAQLNAISDETSLQLRDLAAAFPEVAPVMQQMGFSAAAVASSLAGMYRRGIPATEAAHGLKFALQRLVVPTKDSKKIIDELGFSFTDANGSMMNGALQVMRLAEQLNNMNDAQRLVAAPELFGGRQSARMNSYFADISLGNEEYRKLKAGILEVNQVQSDFLRGMIASGEIPMEGVDDATDRYARAVEEIKKDPSKALARIKSQMQVVSYEIGKSLAPAVITVGQKLVELLQKFTDAPPIIQKMTLAFGALVAAIGPIRYIFAQLKYTFVSFVEVFNKFLPKMRDLPGGMSQVQKLFDIDPMRKDIAQIGDKFVLVQKGFMNKIRMKFGLPPKAKGQVLDYFDSFDQAAASTAGASTAANNKITASNAILQTSEDQVSDEFDETARAAARRVAATDAIIAANQRLTVSNVTAKAAESVSGAIPMPGVPIPRAMPSVPGSAPIAGLATTAISQYSASTEEALNKILKLKERLKLLDGEEAAATSRKISALSSQYNVTEEAIEQFAKSKIAAKAAAGSVDDIAKSALGAGTQMKMLTAGTQSTALAAGAAGAATKGGFLATIMAGGPVVWGILAAIAAVIAVIGIAFLLLRNRWDQVRKIIEPSLEKLKTAFDNVKKAMKVLGDAFSSLGDVFGNIFGQLGSAEAAGDSFASGFGGALSTVIDFIAELVQGVSYVIEEISKLVVYLTPVVESFAYRVKDVVGFITSLIKGDLVGAFKFLVAAVYEVARPFVITWQYVVKITAWFVANVYSLLGRLANVLVKNPIGNALESSSASIHDWASNLNFVGLIDSKLRTGLGGVFGSSTQGAADEAEPEVVDAGNGLGDTFAESFNESVESGVGNEWLKDWLSQIKSVLDSKLGELRQSAVDALKKAHEESLKVYDERVTAIEDQEKAEEKLLRSQQYIAKRRELLQQRELDKMNYRNDRARALYEGRVDDVRRLDLEEQKNRSNFNRQVTDLDDDRGKELLKEQRDALKAQIKAEQDAAKERFGIQEDAFQKSLDLITKYAPKTVAEYNTMLQKINTLLRDNGVSTWPEMAKDGMTAFAEVFREASDNIREDFAWSGKSLATAWMEGFAPEDVIAILKQNLSGGDAGGTPGVGGGGGGFDMPPSSGEGGGDALKVPNIGAAFGKVSSFIKEWWPSILAFMMSPFAGIGSVIAKLLMGVDWGAVGSAIWDGIKTALGAVGGFFGTIFEGAEGGVASSLDPVIGTVQDVFSTIYNTVENILNPIIGTVQTIFTKVSGVIKRVVFPVIQTLGNVFSTVFKKIKDTISNTWNNTIKPIFNFIGQIITGFLVPVFQLLIGVIALPFMIFKHAVSVAWDAVKPIFQSIWGWITDSLIPSFGNIGDVVSTVWGGITDAISRAWNSYIKPVFMAVWNTISSVLTPVFNFLKDTVMTVWNWISAAIGWAWGAIQPVFGAIQWYIGVLAGAFTWFKNTSYNIWVGVAAIISNAWTAISNTISGVWTGIVDTVAGVWNWIAIKIENVVNGFINIYNKLPSQVRPWTIEKVDLPEIRRAQGGPMEGTGFMGAVNKPTYLVGEGRSAYPEYVIPTDPAYRNQASELLGKAAAAIGSKAGAVNASLANTSSSMSAASGYAQSTNISSDQNVYISVDTFIGEEQWFSELASKYNMKTVPRQRKVDGQQKRVVSSYNDRWSLK